MLINCCYLYNTIIYLLQIQQKHKTKSTHHLQFKYIEIHSKNTWKMQKSQHQWFSSCRPVDQNVSPAVGCRRMTANRSLGNTVVWLHNENSSVFENWQLKRLIVKQEESLCSLHWISNAKIHNLLTFLTIILFIVSTHIGLMRRMFFQIALPWLQ